MVLLDERERRRREYFLGIAALVSSHEKKIIIYLVFFCFFYYFINICKRNILHRSTLLGTTTKSQIRNDRLDFFWSGDLAI